ncbi:MAG: hypothetical protein KBD64_02270 [Gammaproteobacteria bacterium]|nr:hypothetical protein [Gammaproteobacteria bacterium]
MNFFRRIRVLVGRLATQVSQRTSHPSSPDPRGLPPAEFVVPYYQPTVGSNPRGEMLPSVSSIISIPDWMYLSLPEAYIGVPGKIFEPSVKTISTAPTGFQRHFDEVDVPGDGNCLFSAINIHLEAPHDLRREVCDELLRDSNSYIWHIQPLDEHKEDIGAEASPDLSTAMADSMGCEFTVVEGVASLKVIETDAARRLYFRCYVDKMRENGVFGTEVELHALANVLQRPIVVSSPVLPLCVYGVQYRNDAGLVGPIFIQHKDLHYKASVLKAGVDLDTVIAEIPEFRRTSAPRMGM